MQKTTKLNNVDTLVLEVLQGSGGTEIERRMHTIVFFTSLVSERPIVTDFTKQYNGVTSNRVSSSIESLKSDWIHETDKGLALATQAFCSCCDADFNLNKETEQSVEEAIDLIEDVPEETIWSRLSNIGFYSDLRKYESLDVYTISEEETSQVKSLFR